MSTHAGQAECIEAALRLGWFEVMLVGHNFMYPPAIGEAMKAAADQGVGVMAIKVCKALTGGQDWYPRATEEQRAVLGQANLFQASLKWTLKHEFISAAVVCLANYDEAEQDLAAAREALTAGEARALDAYRELAAAAVCRGCGRCDRACPRGIPVSDILRYHAYCEGYGQAAEAARQYRQLAHDRTFAGCDRCGACEAACPHRLGVLGHLERAHRRLA
jgi:predicted aldo/keto reductase-like oxidoreductase